MGRELEDAFIERVKGDGIALTFEAEQLLRYGFSEGARIQGAISYSNGVDVQRSRVLEALGASPFSRERIP